MQVHELFVKEREKGSGRKINNLYEEREEDIRGRERERERGV